MLSRLVQFLSWTIARTPRRLQLLLGDILGLFIFDVLRFRRKIALDNLTIAFPEWTHSQKIKLLRANYRHYGRSFMEVFLGPGFNKQLFDRLFRVHGIEHIEKARAKGKGIFLLSLHMGNFELFLNCAFILGVPFSVISKKFKSKWLNDLWYGIREKNGLRIIAPEKSSYEILRAVRRGEAVGFILDQFMGPPVGTRVKFFKKETGAAMSLALFHGRTGASVVPVYNYRDQSGILHVHFLPEVEFQAPFEERDKNTSFMTQVYTSKLEEMVRIHPDQWMWIHRRWKEFRD